MNRCRFYIIMIAFLMPIQLWALGMPQWVNHLPKATNDTYYYRITKAEAQTYEEAYVRAFSMAILESQWKMGVKVSKGSDYQSIENTVKNDLNVQTQGMNLPMNKVCEYEKTSPTGGVILYVLWQVACYGNQKTFFEDYLDCE